MIEKTLHWAPRVLAVLYAAFLALFALDVFGMGLAMWRTTLALLIHLAPVYLVAGALAVAWRRRKAGGALFILLGLAYLVFTGGTFPMATYLVISGPPLVIGLLFIRDGLVQR